MGTLQPDGYGEEVSGGVCPACGVEAVREEFSGWVLFGLVFLWPFGAIRRRYSCEGCGHRWRRFGW